MMSRSRPNHDPGAGRTGTSRATGRPRFVITISLPVSATSSISPKHFALNSVAVIGRADLPDTLTPRVSDALVPVCEPRSPWTMIWPTP